MLKLVHINTAKNCTSTGKIAENICSIARNKGWNAFIAHGNRYNNGGKVPGIIVSGKFEEYIHALGSFLFDNHGLLSTNGTYSLISKLERIKPDVVHLHNLHGYYINFKILFDYLSKLSVPVIWTLHDCWAFTGHCTYFDRIGCKKWKQKCMNCPLKSSYPQSLLDQSERNFLLKKELFTSLKNLTLVPVSDWLHSLLNESFFKNHPIYTIHNGIDLNVFKYTKNNFRERMGLLDKFVILGVADGYGDRKGIPEFNKLSEELGDDMKIVMVGVTDYEKKNVSSNILAIGRTRNQQELIDIYSSADVYINPTYEDNFPTTNLEAMACGTPVITYRTGGSPESIGYKTGYIVEKGNYEELKTAILKVKNLGRDYFSEDCVKRVQENYNMYDRFEEYFQLYDSLLKNAKMATLKGG